MRSPSHSAARTRGPGRTRGGACSSRRRASRLPPYRSLPNPAGASRVPALGPGCRSRTGLRDRAPRRPQQRWRAGRRLALLPQRLDAGKAARHPRRTSARRPGRRRAGAAEADLVDETQHRRLLPGQATSTWCAWSARSMRSAAACPRASRCSRTCWRAGRARRSAVISRRRRGACWKRRGATRAHPGFASAGRLGSRPSPPLGPTPLSRARLRSLAGAVAALLAQGSARADTRAVEVPSAAAGRVPATAAASSRSSPSPARPRASSRSKIPATRSCCRSRASGTRRGGCIVTAHARAEAGVSWFGGCLQPLRGRARSRPRSRCASRPTRRCSSSASRTPRCTVAAAARRADALGLGEAAGAPAPRGAARRPRPARERAAAHAAALRVPPGRVRRCAASSTRSRSPTRGSRSAASSLRLRFEVETAPPPERPRRSEPPLSPAQLRAFEDALFAWDAFVTFVVKVGARERSHPSSAPISSPCCSTRARISWRRSSSPRGRGSDRVRALFTKTWTQLAPIFAGLEGGESGWRFLAFVASGDALAALDTAGPAFGVEISSDGLRRLARTLAPDTTGDPLRVERGRRPGAARELRLRRTLAARAGAGRGRAGCGAGPRGRAGRGHERADARGRTAHGRTAAGARAPCGRAAGRVQLTARAGFGAECARSTARARPRSADEHVRADWRTDSATRTGSGAAE